MLSSATHIKNAINDLGVRSYEEFETQRKESLVNNNYLIYVLV